MADRPLPSWKHVLATLVAGADLTSDETEWAMGEILSDAATPAQIAAFAVALRVKGETVEELDGLIRAMYAHAVTIEVPGRSVDVVGTGGDGAHTVNISTMSAIVAAGAGATVVKHGNRSASSMCGAADLLEELGIPLDLEPDRVGALASEVGITFCFAPRFHPALRFAAGPRRELGVPTVFNVIGPLANPARPPAQAVGVADARMAGLLAGVFAGRGVDALVFRGDDGLDELTTATTSRIWVVHDGTVSEEMLDPADLGFEYSPSEVLRGGNPAYNSEVARRLLAGEQGAVRDAVLLNAAAALVAYEGIDGPVTSQLRDATSRAAEAIDSGAAALVLGDWQQAAKNR